MLLGELKGMLLLATPALTDPNFRDGVVLVCHHDDEGSMGLIINRPQHITIGAVLDDLKLGHGAGGLNLPTFEGGPVDPFRGFVLHDARHVYESTLQITPEVHLTTSRDILEELAEKRGPDAYMLVLGYAGWGAGQLQEEINRNDWLIAPSSGDIVFRVPIEQRWSISASTVGVNKAQLSTQVGHA